MRTSKSEKFADVVCTWTQAYFTFGLDAADDFVVAVDQLLVGLVLLAERRLVVLLARVAPEMAGLQGFNIFCTNNIISKMVYKQTNLSSLYENLATLLGNDFIHGLQVLQDHGAPLDLRVIHK